MSNEQAAGLQKIKISLRKTATGAIVPYKGKVEINGMEIGGVTNLEFKIGAGEMGKLTLELIGALEFDITEILPEELAQPQTTPEPTPEDPPSELQ